MRPAANSVASSHDAKSHGRPRRDSRSLRSSEDHLSMAITKKRNSFQESVLYAAPGLTTPVPSTASPNSWWSSGKSRPDQFQISPIRFRLLAGPMDRGCWIKRYTHVISAQRHWASSEAGPSWRWSFTKKESEDRSSRFSTYRVRSSWKFTGVHRGRSVNRDCSPSRHRCFHCSAAVRMCSAAFSRLNGGLSLASYVMPV